MFQSILARSRLDRLAEGAHVARVAAVVGLGAAGTLAALGAVAGEATAPPSVAAHRDDRAPPVAGRDGLAHALCVCFGRPERAAGSSPRRVAPTC